MWALVLFGFCPSKDGGRGQADDSLQGFGAGSPMSLLGCFGLVLFYVVVRPGRRVAKILVVSLMVIEAHPFVDVFAEFFHICVAV